MCILTRLPKKSKQFCFYFSRFGGIPPDSASIMLLAAISDIFDLVSKNTNAQITNTYYSLKNRKTYESKAKEEAVKDARVQVESVAKINHLRVGKLVSLEDNNNPRPYMMELKTTDNSSGNDITQSALAIQETDEANTFYSEQSVKITSSYTATYELY